MSAAFDAFKLRRPWRYAVVARHALRSVRTFGLGLAFGFCLGFLIVSMVGGLA